MQRKDGPLPSFSGIDKQFEREEPVAPSWTSGLRLRQDSIFPHLREVAVEGEDVFDLQAIHQDERRAVG